MKYLKYIIAGIIFLVIILYITNKDTVEKMIKKGGTTLQELASKIATNYLNFINLYATQFGVTDGKSIVAVIIKESGGVVDPIRRQGDGLGLMQVTLRNAKEHGFKDTENDLVAPITNLFYGIKYWSECLTHEQGNLFNAYRAYNGGLGWRKSSSKALATTLKNATAYQSIYNAI